MKTLIQFTCLSKTRNLSSNVVYNVGEAQNHDSSDNVKNPFNGCVFACHLRVVEDTFVFDLFESMKPYLAALAGTIKSVIDGANSSRIDIPDYDVDLYLRRLGPDEFEVGLMRENKLLHSSLTNARSLRASLEALPTDE